MLVPGGAQMGWELPALPLPSFWGHFPPTRWAVSFCPIAAGPQPPAPHPLLCSGLRGSIDLVS